MLYKKSPNTLEWPQLRMDYLTPLTTNQDGGTMTRDDVLYTSNALPRLAEYYGWAVVDEYKYAEYLAAFRHFVCFVGIHNVNVNTFLSFVQKYKGTYTCKEDIAKEYYCESEWNKSIPRDIYQSIDWDKVFNLLKAEGIFSCVYCLYPKREHLIYVFGI